jgi:hypothetical protein
MAVKRSFIEVVHDEGYGEDLLQHVNDAFRGKDMQAKNVYDGDLAAAAMEAYEALVGVTASYDSVQGRACIRLRAALGLAEPDKD